MVGSVRDEQGGRLPEVTVTARNPQALTTNITRCGGSEIVREKGNCGSTI